MTDNQEKGSIEKLLKDHQLLMEYLCGVREWTRDVSELGMPRFGELGTRLVTFRETLAEHFEDEESRECAILGSKHAPDTDGANNEWTGLHHAYLEQLDDLVRRLKATEPEFPSWQDAVGAVEALITEICEHEEQEIQFLWSSLSKIK